nr:transporter [Bacteroidota bacterium]
FEIGYFFSKAQTFVFGFDRSSHGLGDGVIGLQYNAYKNFQREFDIFPYARVTLPIGEFDQMNGPVVLPIDIQPSSGSYKYSLGCLFSKRYKEGKWAFFVDGSAELSQRIETDRTNYKYGNLYNVSLYGSYKFLEKLTGALQIRSQVREKASDKNGDLVNATGGHVMFLSPQVRYNFIKFWNAGFVFEYPFYKNMNGKQLTNKYALTFKVSRTINFNQ